MPAKHKNLITILGITALVWYLTMCFRVSLQGRFFWGNRLLVPIIPILILPLAFIKLDNILNKLLLTLTQLGSIVNQFAGLFTKIHENILIKIEIHYLIGQDPHSKLLRGIELFFHKLKTADAKYLVTEFGIISKEIINLTNYDTFHGFNIWIVHLLNRLGLKEHYSVAGIILLSIIIIICIALFINIFTKLMLIIIKFKN